MGVDLDGIRFACSVDPCRSFRMVYIAVEVLLISYINAVDHCRSFRVHIT